jgi:hypothetical protein
MRGYAHEPFGVRAALLRVLVADGALANQHRRKVMTSIRTCALAMAAVFFIGSQASAQGQGGPAVTVVNTPLPVTVTNPTVPPSTVNVGNPADLAAANASALGVKTPVVIHFVSGAGNVYNVPPTQRLVIEYVGGQCSTSSSTQAPSFSLSLHTGGALTDLFLQIPTPFPVSNFFIWQFGQLVKTYADPGTQVGLILHFTGGCDLNVSGQLVNP